MSEKSLKKNSLYNIIYSVANILFPLITSIYVARVLFTDGIGRVAYGQNIASYFLILASLGLPTYGVREIAKVRGSREGTNKVFSALFVINSCSTTIASVAYIVLVLSVLKFRSDHTLFLCCGLQIIMNYFNIDWFYQGQEEYRYITIRSILVKLLCFLAVLIFVREIEDYVIYAFISSLAITLNNVFNIIHVRKFVKLEFKKLELKRHFTPLLVLALSVFLSSAYSKIDVTMLGSMTTDTATGLYNNAHKIVEVIITVCTAVSAVFLPRLSYYYEHDREEFGELIEKGIKVLSFITFPICIGLFVLAPQMMKILYGNSFVPGSLTVRIFAVLIIIKSFGNLLCYQLIVATGNEKKRLPAYLAAAILNIIFNAFLIPGMHQNGAAIASVISEFVVNTIQLFAISKIIHISVPGKSMFQGIITTAIMGAVVFVISQWNINFYVQTIGAVVVGAIVYFALNIVIKNEMALMGFNMIKTKIRRIK
ncbi:MAG: flippase [Eubacteriales bacterium]|nr:flippase [Eubacteriales bacterium]